METKFQPTNEPPLAALTIGQFKDLLGEMVKPHLVVQTKQESFPDTFGKNECSKLTGFKLSKSLSKKKKTSYQMGGLQNELQRTF